MCLPSSIFALGFELFCGYCLRIYWPVLKVYLQDRLRKEIPIKEWHIFMLLQSDPSSSWREKAVTYTLLSRFGKRTIYLISFVYFFLNFISFNCFDASLENILRAIQRSTSYISELIGKTLQTDFNVIFKEFNGV